MNLKIDSSNANKLFFEILYDYSLSDKTFNLFCGSAGSGKSVAIQQFIIITCLSEKHKWLCLRAVAATIRDTLEAAFIEVLDNFGLENGIDYTHNKTSHSIKFPNGSEILMKGCDVIDKVKSTPNISNVFVEEATELANVSSNPMTIIDKLLFRLRGPATIGKRRGQIYMAFNPDDESNFVKKNFYDIERTDANYSKTTYLDNNFIGNHRKYAEKFDYLKVINPQIWKSLLLGEWGQIEIMNRMYTAFQYKQHVIEDFRYDPDRELLISFDENVSPHISISIAQRVGKQIVIFDEVAVSGNTHTTMSHFVKKYNGHRGRIKVYGDATSNKNVTSGDDNKFYRIIQNALDSAGLRSRMLVAKSNENVMTRANFINYAFFSNDIEIKITKSCEKLIADLLFVKWDSSGSKKLKEKERGESYEKYGHLSDCFDYMIVGEFRQEYNAYITNNSKAIKKTGGAKRTGRF